MDWTSLSIIVLSILFFFSIYVRRNLPKWVGAIGEKKVRKEISKIQNLHPNTYTDYHDLYIPKPDGTFSQIDHILVSEFGIFVLETKNYSGWIFADEKKKYWTQVIYKRKEKFLNPIWQNKGHIKSLKEYLGIDGEKVPFHSIIVFTGNPEFKNGRDFRQAKVIYRRQLKTAISDYKERAISQNMLHQISGKLEKLIISDGKTKKQIVRARRVSINKKQKEEKRLIRQNTCPKCGGKMIIKKGKYGKFKACSNYPKCRFSVKV